jgi:hypothetical protein
MRPVGLARRRTCFEEGAAECGRRRVDVGALGVREKVVR